MKNKICKLLSVLLSFSVILSLTGCRIVYKVDEKTVDKISYDVVTVEDDAGTSGNNASKSGTGKSDQKGNTANGNAVTADNVTGNITDGKTNTDKNSQNTTSGHSNSQKISGIPEIGSTEGAGGNAKAVKEKKLSGSLKIQVFINEAQNPSDAWTAVADAFEEITGVNVTLIMGSQVNTQYSARWLAGEAPADIVWISGNGLPDEQMAKSGVFCDLSDIIKKGNIYNSSAKISDSINMNVIEAENGKIFRAPLMTSVQGLWYNKNVIKKPPKNYNDFKAVSLKQKSGLTYPGQYADYSTWALFMPAVAAYGQDFFNKVASGQPSAFKDKRFISVLTKYKDYCDSGLVLTGSSSADHISSQLNWLNGKCGFITNGLWLESEMHDYIPGNFHMAFMASPFIDKNQKPTVVFTSASLAVASKAKNIENAKAFIRFVYRQDVQLAFMGKYSYASALKTVDYSNANMSSVARETLDYIYSNEVNRVNKGVRWNDLINNEFKNVINDMTNGSMSVKEASNALYNTAKKSS